MSCRIPSSEQSSLAKGFLFGLLLVSPLPAAALTIDDVTPLYFQADQGQGFDPADVAASGIAPSLEATPSDLFIGAGGPSSGASVRVSSQAITTIHQLPATATPSDPAIVDSTWTIENVSAGALAAPVLLFTVLDPLNTYPGNPQIGLDGDLLDLLRYVPPSGPDILYGAIVLPDLAEGESTEILVRYVVGGPLAISDASQVLAPLGLAVALSYTEVPEPTTLLLCATGLAGIALFGRRRETARGGRSMESAGCPTSRERGRQPEASG